MWQIIEMAAKRETKTKKPKTAKEPEETSLDPEVEAFVNWFADWWLRRGRRLVEAAKKEDPNFAKRRKRPTHRRDRLPFHWDEETERFVLDTEEDARG